MTITLPLLRSERAFGRAAHLPPAGDHAISPLRGNASLGLRPPANGLAAARDRADGSRPSGRAPSGSRDRAIWQVVAGLFLALLVALGLTVALAPSAAAQEVTTTTIAVDDENDAVFNLDLGESENGEVPSQSIIIILTLTLLSVAPALLLMMTSFTRIVIVLSLTRNALGLQAIPPNQVVIGLALFLSLFTMAPTLKELNDEALQPFLHGEKSQAEAFEDAEAPIREHMLGQVRDGELALFVRASTDQRPDSPEDVSLTALIPAYVLSELKTAFIIGFVVFIPFLVIDLVVSSSLMSMGMMMLPPVLISLPFKLLLFVMVDGWALVVRALLTSFQ